MRSRRFLLTPLLLALFVVPHFAQASIPFFGPIIPPGVTSSVCPAGWGMLIDVINRIIELLITIAIVFVAPLMLAYAGFLMVINQGNSEKLNQAKGVLTNTIVGIVIALAAWMIVDAIMAALYNGRVGTWTTLISSGGQSPCLDQQGALPGQDLQQGAPPVSTEPTQSTPSLTVSCSAGSLPAITDPLAQQMEDGQTVIWTNTDSNLQPCVNKFIGILHAGTVTSAYRPESYQTHLSQIRDVWCTQGLRSNTDPSCTSLKSSVSAEVATHFGYKWDCGAVASGKSTHSSGTGVDISGIDQSSAAAKQAAGQSCLTWANYSGDPYHYNLVPGCSCN